MTRTQPSPPTSPSPHHGSVPAGAVVVALDGSDHAERALAWAAEQADLEHRPLVLLHAVGIGSVQAAAWAGPGLPVTDLIAESRAEATRVLDEARAWVREHHADVEVHPVVSDDDPRSALLDASRDAHLLVLGSRGRGVVRSLLLGSVSAAVSRHAACPVVVTRPRPEGAASAGVLVGLDGTQGSSEVALHAFQLASFRALPLTVVHCYWDAVAAYAAVHPSTAADVDSADRLADLDAVVSTTLAGLGEKFPDVAVTRRVRHGLVDQVLTEDSESWDLVVVGRHRRSGWEHLLGHSLSSAVLERARTAVAVVPHGDHAPA